MENLCNHLKNRIRFYYSKINGVVLMVFIIALPSITFAKSVKTSAQQQTAVEINGGANCGEKLAIHMEAVQSKLAANFDEQDLNKCAKNQGSYQTAWKILELMSKKVMSQPVKLLIDLHAMKDSYRIASILHDEFGVSTAESTVLAKNFLRENLPIKGSK